jgi:hypothetical protein
MASFPGTPQPSNLELYEEATRGAWGAVNFLWQFGLHEITASTAALITILSLLVGPTTQQIINYPSGLVLVNTTDWAWISVNQTYNTYPSFNISQQSGS